MAEKPQEGGAVEKVEWTDFDRCSGRAVGVGMGMGVGGFAGAGVDESPHSGPCP